MAKIKKEYINKQNLEELYIKKEMSSWDIAKFIGISQTWVRKLLKEYQIPVRVAWNSKCKGKPLSEEHKRKISEANKNSEKFQKAQKERAEKRKFRIKFNCEQCQKECEITKAKFERVKNHFCSIKCSGIAKIGKFLGEKNPNWKGVRKPKKQYPRKKLETQCKNCNARVFRSKQDIKNAKYGNFCSKECKSLWLSTNVNGDKIYNFAGGYKEYYGPSWGSAKILARRRDNNTCQRCFKTKLENNNKNMDVHHLVPFREFGVENHLQANRPNNLKCFCIVCHKIEEEKYNKRKRELIKIFSSP
jgi:predicted transcriptional regulator